MDMQSAMLHAFDMVWAIPEPKGSVTLEGSSIPVEDFFEVPLVEDLYEWDELPELIGEGYEHLPQRQGRLASFLAHGENACFASPEDKRDGRQSHGKRGRLCGRKLYMHRHIRAARQQTHRQMDEFWLREMSDVMPSHMSVEDFLDAHDEFSGIDPEEHLREINLEMGFASVEEDEDPWEVNEYFWGVESYPDPCPPPLTAEEEWKLVEQEERRQKEAAEKAAEAFEASFEHIPACNQIGRKAQRMHAAVVV